MQFQGRYYITPAVWKDAITKESLLCYIWRYMKVAGMIPDTAVWSGMEGDFFIGYILQARW